MIELKEVTKVYGKQEVVHKVSLHVRQGDLVGLVGPNGAGKSTLLQMIATISKPSSGSIAIQDKDTRKHLQHVRKFIGYVPQDPALFMDLSVRDNLSFFAKMAFVQVAREYIDMIVERVGLSSSLSTKVAHLSGGMQRKLNIAVALLHDPPVLIMDEPTVGIDIQSKQEIMSFIRSLSEQGRTILYSTHDVQEIEFLCTKWAIMNKGILKFYGTMEEAYRTFFQEKECLPTKSEGRQSSLAELLSFLGGWKDNWS